MTDRNDRVTIVDYGLGNIFSVERAFRYVGAETEITDSPDKIERAARLVIPGVGSFGDGMKGLEDRGLIESIKRYAASGRPLLGICLGMQLLMSEGEEFGYHEGLGLISGKVAPLNSFSKMDSAYKIPHIGWNRLSPSSGHYGIWDNTILQGISEGTFVYFVHSNIVVPTEKSQCLAETSYSTVFCSVIRKNNIYGCQFHPERSGKAGLKIYQQFIFGL